jgi:hypothetical protein
VIASHLEDPDTDPRIYVLFTKSREEVVNTVREFEEFAITIEPDGIADKILFTPLPLKPPLETGREPDCTFDKLFTFGSG